MNSNSNWKNLVSVLITGNVKVNFKLLFASQKLANDGVKCNGVDGSTTIVMQCFCNALLSWLHSFSNSPSAGAIVFRAKLEPFSIGL